MNTGQTLPSGANSDTKSTTWPCSGPGRAEDPVDEVAQRAAEHQAQRDGPAGGAQPPRDPDDHHDDRRRATSDSTQV